MLVRMPAIYFRNVPFEQYYQSYSLFLNLVPHTAFVVLSSHSTLILPHRNCYFLLLHLLALFLPSSNHSPSFRFQYRFIRYPAIAINGREMKYTSSVIIAITVHLSIIVSPPLSTLLLARHLLHIVQHPANACTPLPFLLYAC